MKLEMENLEKGWAVRRCMELQLDLETEEKVAASVLRVIANARKEQAKKEEEKAEAALEEAARSTFSILPAASPLSQAAPAAEGELPEGQEKPVWTAPVGGAKETESVGGAKETEPVGAEKPAHLEKARGFVILECDHCRKQRAFMTKVPMKRFTCNSCGKTTELRDLVEAQFVCPGCHKTWTYTTNSLEPDITCSCVGCGETMTAWWNDKAKRYEGR